ncbi:MAG: SIS domain-containing protein [Methylophilaceae bacterium]|nr:SIS domain-containing protein [Methylophilaceae bacterium]
MLLSPRIIAHFEQSGRLKLELAELLSSPIAQSAEMIAEALLSEKKVLSCGNGGAAACAQYFASLLLNRYEIERPSLAAMALAADSVTLSAVADDSHFEQVFSRQIMGLGQARDVLLAISSSGNSANILNAIKAAKERDMPVIAISGGDGGSLVELLGENDIHIGVPHDSPARVVEVTVLILHCLCDAVDCLLLGEH